MFKKTLFTLCLGFCLMISSTAVYADVCCPDDPDFDAAACTAGGGSVLAPGCSTGGPAIPFDGGISAFAGLAMAYGASRLRRKKQAGDF
jgi:hypothetical protein